MGNLTLLKQEMARLDFAGCNRIEDYLRYLGYRDHFSDDPMIAKAHAVAALFTRHEKHIYDNDLVAGSIKGCYSRDISAAELEYAAKIAKSYGKNTFWTNLDHDTIDHKTTLAIGVGGIIEKINASLRKYADFEKQQFLRAALITMTAFSEMVRGYAQAARKKAEATGRENLFEIARICDKVAYDRPESFHEALQLVWLIHTSFQYESRQSMALGRIDQYLYPFYERDFLRGGLAEVFEHEKTQTLAHTHTLAPYERSLAHECAEARERVVSQKWTPSALDLVSSTLYKIYEKNIVTRQLFGSGQNDTVNIAIGGVRRDGSDAVNELTYIVLDAVKDCKVPGPNLSARVSRKNPDAFVNKCLEVIGTGIGYPALMNDEVNIAALSRYGYAIEDCRDYCMVGCIENFIPGKQPPWSDGRYNSPKYLELTLNNGRCMLTGVQMGPQTGDASDFNSMESFLSALKIQLEHGAAEYVAIFNNESARYDRALYAQPYLSCYHESCIERGLDVRGGGSVYPSIHGAVSMGIATFADSLAAIERLVYEERAMSLAQLRDALSVNCEGRGDLRQQLLNAPKYGNNDEFVDKYARWYMDTHYDIFSRHQTVDGGGIYVAIASNVSNIPAGLEVAATPDGRGSKEPLSDAASPSHGLDKNGITAVLLSCSKPDYTKSACGTVLNVKFESGVFRKSNMDKLRSLVRVYFERGGQEMQVNCVSRKQLMEASANPDKYRNLVVRVSGFSAFYTDLSAEVQKDILERTEYTQ